MRTLFSLIALGAIVFLVLASHEELKHRLTAPPATSHATASTAALQPAARPISKVIESTAPAATPSDIASPASEVPGAPPASPRPRLRTAPPGTFFLAQRVTVTTDAGVLAILPGEEVKLLYRNKNGTARVKWGNHEFVVPEAQLAREIDLATNRPITSPAATSPTQLLGQRGS